jgi:DNA-binding XRE family transcriptional regulator
MRRFSVPTEDDMRRARILSGVTVVDAAAAVGVACETLRNWEQRRSSMPVVAARQLVDYYSEAPDCHIPGPAELRECRLAAGVRLCNAAAEIGVEPQTLHGMELGNQLLRLERAAALLELYRETPDGEQTTLALLG